MPVGMLEVTTGGTRFIPTVDSGKLAVMGMLLAAWNIFWIARTLRAVLGKK